MKKYNRQLFLIGFLMNITKNFLLLIPGVLLCIVGIWVRICLIIGLSLLAIDLIISFVEQLQIKNTVENTNNPNLVPWANAMMSDDWKSSVQDLLNNTIDENNTDDNKED